MGGGGSPNRTTSGTVVTTLKMNPELRFQADHFKKDVDPRLVSLHNVLVLSANHSMCMNTKIAEV